MINCKLVLTPLVYSEKMSKEDGTKKVDGSYYKNFNLMLNISKEKLQIQCLNFLVFSI